MKLSHSGRIAEGSFRSCWDFEQTDYKELLLESDSKWVQRASYIDQISAQMGKDGIKHLPEETFQSDVDYAT